RLLSERTVGHASALLLPHCRGKHLPQLVWEPCCVEVVAGQQTECLHVEEKGHWCPLHPRRRGVDRRQRVERAVDLHHVEEARIPPEPLRGRHRLAWVE